jgi:membrane protein implicated in regulation of membrane protease activity
MERHTEAPSPADLAGEASGLLAGLGIVTIQFFPFAMPLLILVIGPLALLALPILVLALPILLPLWLFRRVRARLDRRRTQAPGRAGGRRRPASPAESSLG